MVYWYVKRMKYLPSIETQVKTQELYFRQYDHVERMGTNTLHTCKTLSLADFLTKGDVVGMTSVMMISTNLSEIRNTLKSMHDQGIGLYIHDIGYFDDPSDSSSEAQYKLLEQFLKQYELYRSKLRNSNSVRGVGRPGYHFRDLSLPQKNVISDFREGNLSKQAALMELSINGLEISERTLFKLQKELDSLYGKPHKKKEVKRRSKL